MPGVTDALPVGPLATLMALPEGNQYRLVAERRYRPKIAPDDDQWRRCLPLLLEILAADPKRFSQSQRLLNGRRAALARHVYWLAGEHPDRLNPDFALDEIQVERSALLSEGHVTYKSQISYKSQLGSFRAGFPKLFPTCKQISPPRGLEATKDRELLIALNAAETFRNDGTCDRVRAMLLLCRGAGLDSVDCRYVAGTDVFRRPGAGLWVRVANTEAPREVPVLARFAGDLEKLAARAGDNALIAQYPPPVALGQTSELTDRLIRRMRGQYPKLRVTPSRLRKAWIREQIEGWEQLHVFLQAAGLKSLHSVDGRDLSCPNLPTDPVHKARLLGGIT
ncbi:MAG: hypothetical protein WBU92_11515 [Candidatus Dormiibacterota bacterium]